EDMKQFAMLLAFCWSAWVICQRINPLYRSRRPRIGWPIPTPPLGDLTHFPDFDELRRRAKGSGEALITYAEQVEQGELSQILHLDGGTYDAPVIVVVIQAINHAIDHRSQIATLLSQQDIEPPDLDGWAYNDAMHERSCEKSTKRPRE